MVIFAVLAWVAQAIFPIVQDAVGGLEAVALAVVSFVVSSLIAIGWIELALDITDGERVVVDAIIERSGCLCPTSSRRSS